MKLVLLHSPLVTPGTWDALAPTLRDHDHDVAIPDFTATMQGVAPYYAKLAAAACQAVGDESIVVAHSGAGALVPAIAAAANLRGAIFLDALLPHPGRSWFETAPAALAAQLRGLACDGRLPPWQRWWPKGAIEKLLPDAAMCARFAAGLRELPLAYFEEAAPGVGFEAPAAYLQLSSGYDMEAEACAARGWPVARLDLHHLAMLTHPGAVTDAIEQLAAGL